MSDTKTGEVAPPPAAGPGDVSRFDKFFSVVSTEAPAVVAPPEEAAPPPPAAETPVVEEAPKFAPDLALKIRAEREARAARTAHESEAKTLRERLEAAEARLAALSKSDVVADPIGWAEAHGLTPDERALLGESLLYSLVPDKATPEVRIRLMEAKHARQAKQAEEAAKRSQSEAEQAHIKQVHDNYVAALSEQAKSSASGTYPDSEAWFGGDHDSYTQSLYQTANNLAEMARMEGKVADLTFGAVAKALEAELTSRFSRRSARTASPTTQPVAAPPAGSQAVGTQPEGTTMSTKGMGGGPPRSPAKTEAERIARAAELVFRTK